MSDTDTPALDAVVGLVRLVSEQWDAIEADFRRFYGLDLGAVCFGPDAMGMRRLRVLISHLPPESSLARAMGWWWTDAHEMQAQLIELAYLSAQATTVSVNALSGKRWHPKPVRFPRPQLPTAPAPPALPRAVPPTLTREAIRTMLTRTG